MKNDMILVKVKDQISDNRYWYKKHRGEMLWVFEKQGYNMDYLLPDGTAIKKSDCEKV